MTTQKRRELPHERENRKLSEILHTLMDLVGADSAHNLLQKVTSLHSTLTAEQEKYSTLVETLCAETDTQNIGRVIDRVKSWKRKNGGKTFSEQHGLDSSFLRKPSPVWVKTISIDNPKWEKEKLDWDKQRSRWQNSCEKMYLTYLEEVYEECLAENIPEEDIKGYLNLARAQVREDYLTLDYTEFFRKYDVDVNVSLKIVEHTTKVPFSDCLPLIKDFAPRQLYKELASDSSLLGEVSVTQFNSWDEKFAKYQQEPAKEGVPKLRVLMRKIVGGMVYRILREESGWPTTLEESKLEMLLSTPEENAASADWEVDDSTTLTQFALHFEQLAGTNK